MSYVIMFYLLIIQALLAYTKSTANEISIEKRANEHTYMGCFNDEERALDFHNVVDHPSMTIATCIDICTAEMGDLNVIYAGTEASDQCFCGIDYNKYGEISESECNLECVGDRSEICGGELTLSVYRIARFAVETTYQGCYKDGNINALNIYSTLADDNMNIEKCQGICMNAIGSLNVIYAGVEQSNQCFCGTTFDRFGAADSEDECNMQCSGDDTQTCGGSLRMNVYKLERLDGVVSGDPHLRTFDGRRYSYQGLCWHTLFKDCSKSKPAFEISAKFEAPKYSTTDEFRTRTVAINVTLGNEYAVVDGLNVMTGTTKRNTVMPKRIRIEEDGKMVALTFTSKNTTFTLNWTLLRHVFDASFIGVDYNGKLCGLLGNADGDGHNDFVKPNGNIANDVDEFGESWKVEGQK
uniref:IgGFc-binding protein-like n=1 Tax=Saccoglossus kowalevskii TaxID=10224 RepID=A0ABM0MVW8_SACKO|nr:PREDICTED: IgGFc-binding protein-like [Saccoglossus kowalevskii]